MPSMENELLRKVSQLNNLFTEIQSYKREHPEQRLGYYEQSIGSILNAYREGDLSFDEAIAAINNTRATPSPVVDESTYPLCPVCPKCQQGYICEHCGDSLPATPAQGWQSIDSLVTKFLNDDYVRCPKCPDQGWYADGPTDDPEQVQCEFCECESRSLFKLKAAIRAALPAPEEQTK